MQVAKIENNIVLEVIVSDSVEWCIDTFGGQWVRTYFNTIGKNFVGVGLRHYTKQTLCKDWISVGNNNFSITKKYKKI